MSRDAGYLLDILNEARLTRSFVEDLEFAAFQSDLLRQRAVVRTIEIIGEAARRISDDFKAQHAHLPWREMIGMRNRLIHEYDSIDLLVVWHVVQNELPALIAQIEPLIPPEDALDDQADN